MLARRKQMTRHQLAVVSLSVLLGLISFHCLWLHFLAPSVQICSSFTYWLVTPVVISIISAGWLGYMFPPEWKKAFAALMLPSIVVRQMSFFFMQDGPGNLWPLFLLADLVLLGVVLLVFAGATRMGRVKSQNQ